MRLDQNLKKLREARGLKQTEIAAIMDVSLAYYNKLERKVMRPSVEMLDKLASFYGILIDEIVHINPGVVSKVARKAGTPVRKSSAGKKRSAKK